MKRLLVPLLFVIAVAATLLLTAKDDDAPTRAMQPPAVPVVSVARLDGGDSFDLTRLAKAESPTLLWFWAPWCEVCNREAPAIERLARQARDQLAVVAIGGRDQIANGPAFVSRHRLRTPTVLFDEPMVAWQAYAIPGQPAAVLLDRSGREQRRWLGAFDTAEVLDAARAF